MELTIFNRLGFLPALKALFKDLNVPINYVADEPTTAKEILEETYKDNAAFKLIDEVYFVGMVDDAAFEGNKSIAAEKIKSDYYGVLIFGITLTQRDKGLLPTRSQLAEISRAFNREFYYTPVIVVFKYNNHLAFANTERLQYKQEWREGEKAGKVTLLRDINIQRPHSGHERILNELRIPTSGKNAVDSFAKLYAYWQEVFSVSLLNKQFYQELSNWYFWAIKQVTFPGMPTAKDAHAKKADLDDLIQEHKATNVIRLLTRLLFVWFVKEKKLIPEDLFELDSLQKDILKKISPYHEKGMFKEANSESIYYKAILQNLFFATLNCPIEGDSLDKRKRGFRGEGYGTHRGIDYLMRYKEYFKNPDKFLDLVNKTVPFLNGGLFECLDDKFNNIYIDGFSDQMTKGEKLIVPDYLFFGVEEKADLSKEYGINNKDTKGAAVKGLVNILKSYKFTITENTPIEEDVALDPELLGKVFENLLASYNPETKTTARKQTGSFYTPREIVNYMVDESLIAYLKNKLLEEPEGFLELGKKQVNLFSNEGKKGQQQLMHKAEVSSFAGMEDELDTLLHQLVSFDPINPFEGHPEVGAKIIQALDKCTILDPACGSGAFPMGILQKMAHILQKLDPENKVWKEVQRSKVLKETEVAFEIEDKQAREDQLLEINNAFDQSINDPDYARKLFLIENCIYGVDIQPIATQISKLRFFISLVVEQKADPEKINFGIRPLPNLETKFVAANTLVGIEKPKAQLSLYDSDAVKALETKLKKVRHKLFSAKSKDTKLKYREIDEELRNAIAIEFEKSGWKSNTAQMLAKWDPYDQNASSPFFNSEWMFDISDGFDILIGNPPYGAKFSKEEKKEYKEKYQLVDSEVESYILFIEKGFSFLNTFGILSYIIPNNILTNSTYKKTREFLLTKTSIKRIIDLGSGVFENASVDTAIVIAKLSKPQVDYKLQFGNYKKRTDFENNKTNKILQSTFIEMPEFIFNSQFNNSSQAIIKKINGILTQLKDKVLISRGVEFGYSSDFIYDEYQKGLDKIIAGRCISPYSIRFEGKFVRYNENDLSNYKPKSIYTEPKILVRRIGHNIIASFDENGYINVCDVYNLLSKGKTDLKFILGIINSKLINYYFKNHFFNSKVLFPKISISNLGQIPIPEGLSEDIIITKVNEVIELKANNLSSAKLEKEIDVIVYKIYKLTWEEVLLIEPEFEQEHNIDQKKYDAIKFNLRSSRDLEIEVESGKNLDSEVTSGKGRNKKVDLSKPVEFDL